MINNLYSIISLSIALSNLFLPGLFAVGAALVAVLTGYFAARNKEKFYLAGMFLGGLVMMFINLQGFGLFPVPGFQLLSEGFEAKDVDKKMRGALLVDQWAQWSQHNRGNLELARNRKFSVVGYFLYQPFCRNIFPGNLSLRYLIRPLLCAEHCKKEQK